ncbi:hypothetical protein TorRG33x02_327720, partial [Trema orientale]
TESRPDTHVSSGRVQGTLPCGARSIVNSSAGSPCVPTFTAVAREDERMIPTGLHLATGQN